MDDRLAAIRRALSDPLLAAGASRIGAFAVRFDDSTAHPVRNYAVQLDPPANGDLDALTTAFRERGLRPRIELIADGLAPEFAAAGYRPHRSLPVLLLGPEGVTRQPAVAGFSVGRARDLLALATMAGLAYGDPEPAVRRAERYAGLLRAGGGAVAAIEIATGRTVSGGVATAPVHGLSEIRVIATDVGFRRRGLAAATVGVLARRLLERGVRTFLRAAGEREAAIFERVGFERCGEQLLLDGPG